MSMEFSHLIHDSSVGSLIFVQCSGQAVNDLSDSWRADGDVGQSISILEDALEVDEYREEIYEKLAELYTEAGDHASASNTLRRSKSIFGETVQLFASGDESSVGEDLAES